MNNIPLIPGNVPNSNVFAPFKKLNGVDYAIVKPVTEQQKIEKKAEKEKKSNALGYSIATTALLAGFGVLALVKGPPKNWYGKINGYFKQIEGKIAKLSEKKNATALQVATLTVLKKASSLIVYTKTLFNFGSFKDVLTNKALKKTPYISGFGPWITNVFEKISVKTLRNSYTRTLGKFDNLNAVFNKAGKNIPNEKLAQKIEIDGHTLTGAQWLKIIEKRANRVDNYVDKGFKGKVWNSRLDKINSNFDGIDPVTGVKGKDLSDKVWDATLGDIGGFVKKIDNYKTFIPEEIVAPLKIENTQIVNELRRKITHDIGDNFRDTKRILKDIDTLINPSDLKANERLKIIGENLDKYKKLSGAEEKTLRNGLNNKIAEDLKKLESHITKSNAYDKNATEKALSSIDKLGNVIQKNKKGEIQEILTVYKQLLPEKEYLKVKKEAYKAVKSLDSSIDLETDKLFEKLRDLKIGSAPTEALGVLTSMGVIGWGLTKADNKDERISVGLKYGIPALGSIVTSLYCTVRLVSGGKSLILGLISGLLINKAGVAIDDSIKHYKENPVNLTSLPNLIKNPLSPITDKTTMI